MASRKERDRERWDCCGGGLAGRKKEEEVEGKKKRLCFLSLFPTASLRERFRFSLSLCSPAQKAAPNSSPSGDSPPHRAFPRPRKTPETFFLHPGDKRLAIGGARGATFGARSFLFSSFHRRERAIVAAFALALKEGKKKDDDVREWQTPPSCQTGGMHRISSPTDGELSL